MGSWAPCAPFLLGEEQKAGTFSLYYKGFPVQTLCKHWTARGQRSLTALPLAPLPRTAPQPSPGRGSPPTAAGRAVPPGDPYGATLYRAGSLVHDSASPARPLLGAGLCESVSVCSLTLCLSLLVPGPRRRPQPLPLSPVGLEGSGDAVAPDCEPRTRGGEWGAEERPRATKSDRSGGLSRSLGRNGQTLVWGVSGTGFYRAPSCGGPHRPAPSV